MSVLGASKLHRYAEELLRNSCCIDGGSVSATLAIRQVGLLGRSTGIAPSGPISAAWEFLCNSCYIDGGNVSATQLH